MGRKIKQNKITSPELLAQVNPENIQLMNDFLDYLRSIGRSEATIKAYEADLKIFWVWCLKNCNNAHFVDLKKRQIIAFQNYLLTENQNNSARVRRLKATLSSFSNFISVCLDDEFEDFKPIIRRIPDPTGEPCQEKTILTDEQVQQILDMLVENKKYEIACFWALACYGGRRKSEIIQYCWDWISPDNMFLGTFYKTPEKIRTKGRGPQGKMLFAYVLAKQFDPYYKLWMDYRRENNIAPDSKWLFPNRADPSQHITIGTVDNWMTYISKHTGIDIYAHCARHYLVTMLSKMGIPAKAITALIGWENSSMCDIYDDTEKDELLGQYFSDGEVHGVQKSLADL